MLAARPDLRFRMRAHPAGGWLDAAAEFVPTRVAPSITERVPLLGADGYFALINQCEHLGRRFGLHPYRIRRLLNRYGSLIDDVLYTGRTTRAVINELFDFGRPASVTLAVLVTALSTRF